VRTDIPDPAGTWAWWADTWGYLNGPLGILLIALLATLAWICWTDYRDHNDPEND
jgi:hypothetical protein